MSDMDAIANRLFPSSVPTPTVNTPAAAPVTAVPENPRVAKVVVQSEPVAQKAEKGVSTGDTPGVPAVEKPAEAPPQTEEKASAPASTIQEPPEAIKALRADPLRRMFGAQGSFASVPLEAAMKDVALAPEIKSAVAAEYREIFADIGASPQDAKEIVDAASRFHAEPMTLERDATNTNAAIQMLNDHYGMDAKAALASAQEMIARDPRLARMLEASRLGNDPKTVLKVVQLARSAKQRGEF